MQELIGFVMIVSLLVWVINNFLGGLTKILSFVVLGALAARIGFPLISDRMPEVADFFQRGTDYFQTELLPALTGDEDVALKSPKSPGLSGTSQDGIQRAPIGSERYAGSSQDQYQYGGSNRDQYIGSSQDGSFRDDGTTSAPSEPTLRDGQTVPPGRTPIPYDDGSGDIPDAGVEPDSSSQQPVTAWW